MGADEGQGLISVKRRLVRRPAVIGAAGTSLAALLGMNAVAFARGLDSPWLLGAVIIADMLVIGVGIVVAAREVLYAEHRTEASEARFDAIVDSAMDAIVTVDAGQRIVVFNRAAEQIFRCPRREALGSSLDRFIPARFRNAHRGHVEQFARTGVTSRRMGDITTLWGLRADGDEFPIEASISQAGNAGERFYTVILRDITLRKQADDALRRSQAELRELSARVLEAREEEKTRIARELHDELGQLLTALKMDLGWLRERLPPDAELGARADEMCLLLARTVSSSRRISADLRPLMLDDLGLADAASWLVEDFGKRSGVACRIEMPGELPELSKAVGTAVYRTIQESLTNIARHAAARNAWVAVKVDPRSIQVEVEDDGRGIAPEDLTKARSLGLKGMRERIAFLGGSLEIERAARGGTRVRVKVPLTGLQEHST